MALGLHSRNQRRSPRVDVLLRVKGEPVPPNFKITIFNLNRTGFAVLSDVRFRPGERLDFRLAKKGGPPVDVTAAAVHSQPLHDSPGLFMTGFTFQPGRSSGRRPDDDILQLMAAVAPAGFRF